MHLHTLDRGSTAVELVVPKSTLNFLGVAGRHGARRGSSGKRKALQDSHPKVRDKYELIENIMVTF